MTSSEKMRAERIGLVTAAGGGTRIQPLPCSKELLPIGFHQKQHGQNRLSMRPKVVSHYLLESMQVAEAQKAYIVLNRTKCDIPAYFGPGDIAGLDIAYVVTDFPYGAPFSLKQACPFVPNATILFGFPDIIFRPNNALRRLVECLEKGNADLILGLFPTKNPTKMDMVRIDNRGKIVDIVIKPQKTALKYTWIIAAWRPSFTSFLQIYLDKVEPELCINFQKNPSSEYYVGNVIIGAMEAGLKIDYETFEFGTFVDIGTPEDLCLAMTQVSKDRGIK
jgi:glucose-1-phosphate thymidylyltransferase